ncbi:MAG: PRC-barrel domain-containing protein [Candidatus Magasanikbacteria bacterium]|jgi:sporulation protein YlmC with PRC-barrel domain|nr:PRC-barrel domain-containing protein [Candidatus Magasanikbacteria bacterium]MBT5262938.1 PRC-barrel domain-containing protein [Candidatus Magasanikbacteria bacterium]MBT5820668.1 PRC-barrel domain-containing protein [Candidatus Magasanikbacteria bacterium]MBT6294322.1 PRC-barrel domain-containing protein [Candidatus Magasanikbacteria bacterium]
MRLRFKQIKKFTVQTLSGSELGGVVDIVFNTEGQDIVQYEVRPSLSRKTFLISRDQIVRFDEGVIVVYDTAVPKEVREKTKNPSGSQPNPLPSV